MSCWRLWIQWSLLTRFDNLPAWRSSPSTYLEWSPEIRWKFDVFSITKYSVLFPIGFIILHIVHCWEHVEMHTRYNCNARYMWTWSFCLIYIDMYYSTSNMKITSIIGSPFISHVFNLTGIGLTPFITTSLNIINIFFSQRSRVQAYSSR